MNDDDFEKKLHALTGALQRPDPTAAWKADILARARREAGAAASRHMLPPRWLMLTWATAWAAILALHFNKPPSLTQPGTGFANSAKASPAPVAPTKPSVTPLLAFHSQLNLNLDQP
jgi:hypothetical protein